MPDCVSVGTGVGAAPAPPSLRTLPGVPRAKLTWQDTLDGLALQALHPLPLSPGTQVPVKLCGLRVSTTAAHFASVALSVPGPQAKFWLQDCGLAGSCAIGPVAVHTPLRPGSLAQSGSVDGTALTRPA